MVEDTTRTWSQSEFVGRAQTPNTTSAAEAVIRRRHLERLVRGGGVDLSRPVLELGCADGLVTQQLLDLGCRQLVSTDIMPAPVAKLEASLSPADHESVLLVVDDLLDLPIPEGAFETVIAWGVLSVTGDFHRALELAWKWLAPGGSLVLAEPVLESVLLYCLVRGDLAEFRRSLKEETRAAMWDRREDRYTVRKLAFYEEALSGLEGAIRVEAGGISVLPSLVIGGVLQDAPVPEAQLEELVTELEDPGLDSLSAWRQAYWLVRKR